MLSILNLIESVSEGFPSYSYKQKQKAARLKLIDLEKFLSTLRSANFGIQNTEFGITK